MVCCLYGEDLRKLNIGDIAFDREMAKGGSSGEHYQPQASWMERKPRIRKPPAKVSTTTWRRRTPRHTPRKNVLSMSSDNVECSPPEAMMVSKGEDPLMVMASSTGYSTDTFERDEEQFMKDLDRPKTPRKVMNTKPVAHENGSAGARGATFVFQKRLARIDWRTVHTIDVDRVIREVGTIMQLADMMFIRIGSQTCSTCQSDY